jgi:hypothetical protein
MENLGVSMGAEITFFIVLYRSALLLIELGQAIHCLVQDSPGRAIVQGTLALSDGNNSTLINLLYFSGIS